MPVQLQVRTHLNANQSGADFQKSLSERLNSSNINGKDTLNALRTYMEGKGENAKIRVVNTTRNADLAFQFKSFGYQPYRKERTAGALIQLLARAGVEVNVASIAVNKVLRDGNNYRTATKALVNAILSDPTVAAALEPSKEQAPDKLGLAAAPGNLINEAGNLRGTYPPPPDRPHLAETGPQAAPAPEASLAPAPKLTNAQIFSLIGNEFKTIYAFNINTSRREDQLLNTKFQHKTGVQAEFHIMKYETDIGIQGKRIINEDYLFEDQHKQADTELPKPFKYLLRQKINDVVVGNPILVSRQQLLTEPAYQDQFFQVLGAITSHHVVPDMPGEPDQPVMFIPLTKPDQASPEGVQNQASDATSHPKASTLDSFLITQKMQVGQDLGKGAFGSVKYLSSVDNNSPRQVVKYFTDKKGDLSPQKLSATRSLKTVSEGYAAYLDTSRDKNWVKPNVVTPGHYLVGKPNLQAGYSELKLVPARDLKQLIRDNATQRLGELQCYGLIMDEAPGLAVNGLMNELARDVKNRVTLATSGLNTLRSLNTRGFIHRDIKPENLTFDREKLSFIDTGMLFKVKKTAADQQSDHQLTESQALQAEQDRIKQLPDEFLGTHVYMHPDLFVKERRIGTQADLHAFGLVILQMESPSVFRAIRKLNDLERDKKNNDKSELAMSPEKYLTRLREVAESTTVTTSVRKSALRILTQIEDSTKLANLGMQCLHKASTHGKDGITAAKWADRKFSDQQYEELLKHPALNPPQGAKS